MPEIDNTAVLNTKHQRELTQVAKSNPLESLMETRLISIPLKSDSKSDRKEHR